MLPSKDIIAIVLALMPGFLAAWVFYGLTAHPRRDQFERTVQALVFSAIIQVITAIVRQILFWLGQVTFVFGDWTTDVALGWSLFIALIFGFVIAALANNNTIHGFLSSRKWNFQKYPDGELPTGWVWTKRTAYPGEWYSAFHCEGQRYIVLNLEDGRRLYGWAEEWPDQPDSGHFKMAEVEWVNDDGSTKLKLDDVSIVLVRAKDVERVEFAKYVYERAATNGE